MIRKWYPLVVALVGLGITIWLMTRVPLV